MHAYVYIYVYMTNNFVVELKHNIEVNYISIKLKKKDPRSCSVVQWLRLCTLNAEGLDGIPGWGIRSHMLQQKILHATTKINDLECCN